MKDDKLVCPICGEPTRIYMGNARKDRLCGKHADMLKVGELSLDENGKFRFNSKNEKNATNDVETKSNNELNCIICGKPSNGKHFCFECWNKYKEKSVDIRITHCTSTQILDEYGSKKIVCKDGRKVRSKAEKIIMDYFFDNYIRVIYEKTIPYVNDKGEEKELHPDFYLKDYDLYIEFNGLTNKSYLKMKSYAQKVYEQKGFQVEILESDDIDDIEVTMEKLLSKYSKK